MKIHWWEQYGRHTCHRNQPGLSFAESLLGEVVLVDGAWRVRVVSIPDKDFFCKDQGTARKKLLELVGGSPVDPWD